MMLKIALAVVLAVAAFAAWAFLSARHLPGGRSQLALALQAFLAAGTADGAGSKCRHGRPVI